MNRLELPAEPGSYRWYYVDASAGDFTAVAIFMIGSLFSPRFGPGAQPRRCAAVNFALYEKGVRRVWVLSEYDACSLDGGVLAIGASTLRYGPGRRAELVIADRTTPWGRPFSARLELEAVGPSCGPLRLVEGLEHLWHPIAPRSRAKVQVPSLELELEADAYHDGNSGDVPLGTDLPGWDWTRTHEGDVTSISYRPWESEQAIAVRACSRSISVTREEASAGERVRTGWGLPVPRGRLLESSPFYARLESRHEGVHVLGEVADFRRFTSPWIRWMARLRTRVERAA